MKDILTAFTLIHLNNNGNEKWNYDDNVNELKINKWIGGVLGKKRENLSRHDK